MFGLGFWEIFVIVLVAIIALGPEKLPTAMVDMVKFFKKARAMFDDAKSTIDNELKLSDLKAEAEKYKTQYESLKKSVDNSTIDNFIENAANAEGKQKTQNTINTSHQVEQVPSTEIKEKVTFSQNTIGDKTNAWRFKTTYRRS